MIFSNVIKLLIIITFSSSLFAGNVFVKECRKTKKISNDIIIHEILPYIKSKQSRTKFRVFDKDLRKLYLEEYKLIINLGHKEKETLKAFQGNNEHRVILVKMLYGKEFCTFMSQLNVLLKNKNNRFEIGLSGRGITSDEIKQLSKKLKINKSITNIYLLYNEIGDEGAREIIAALKINKTIKNIFLSHNEIGYKLMNEINELLKDRITDTEEMKLINKTIHEIYTIISYEEVERIETILNWEIVMGDIEY